MYQTDSTFFYPSICLSINLAIYLSVYPSIYLYRTTPAPTMPIHEYRSKGLCTKQTKCLSIHPSIYLSIHSSIYLSIYVGQPLHLPCLFMSIEVKDYVPNRLNVYAEALANPIKYQQVNRSLEL